MDFGGLQDPMRGNPLPDGWTLIRLGDLGSVRYGLGQPPEQSADGIPMLRATNVKRGRLVSDGLIRIKREAIPESRNPYLCAGDIIVVRSGAYTGDVAMVTQEWAGSVAGYDLVFSSKEQVDPAFCAAVLLSEPIQSFFRGERDRSAQPHLNRQQLESTAIPVPPIDEQRQIAGVLGLVQRAIEQQERLITLTTELKRALLHKLFTEGLRGEPQKQTEIGPVPESWEVLPLGEFLAEAQYGLSTKGTDSGTYPLLRMTNQQEGRISSNNLQYVELTEDQFSKFRMERRDILFNRTNSLDLVGRTAIFDIEGDFVFASYLIRLRTEAERLRPFFLNHYFNWDETQRRLKSIATRAVSQSNISATRLRGFYIPVPDPKEQDEIVENLDCLDRKLGVQLSKKQCLSDLFRTLLHQLMTAQIRVKDLDLSLASLR
jgi:type I restriction enzyme, S subunit